MLSGFVVVGKRISFDTDCYGVFCFVILVFSCVCSMFYWLVGDALLMYYVIVNLRLRVPWFDVCWSFGVIGLEWYPCCRLKHDWSDHV